MQGWEVTVLRIGQMRLEFMDTAGATIEGKCCCNYVQ